MSRPPLTQPTQAQFLEVGRTLWSWHTCGVCQGGKVCSDPYCSRYKTGRLAPFFNYYRLLTAYYEPNIKPGEKSALTSHEDVLRVIKRLRERPTATRAEVEEELFGTQPGQLTIAAADQECAVYLAVNIMFMMNCSAHQQSLGILERGEYQIPWKKDVTMSQFITDAFPTTDHPGLNDHENGNVLDIQRAITAKKLKKYAGITFRGTNDIRSHLRLNRKTLVVDVFHHTAFLKEQLYVTKDMPTSLSISDSLELGVLPRHLVLETLDSVQKVLFPLTDEKSKAILCSLVSTESFDPDCLRFESAAMRNADEKEITYRYFGARLANLYEELQNPQPRGYLEKWLQRKSGARHLMLATLIGVMFAIFLGMASLGVSGYQAWIGYQAWQHPVTNSSY